MEQLFPSQSRGFVVEARRYVELARAQETAEGNARVGAEHYVRAIEMILSAVDLCPCKDSGARRALQSACRPKIAEYFERARLLLRVANEEDVQVQHQHHTELMLHQQYVMTQFQPLGSPPPGDLGSTTFPAAASESTPFHPANVSPPASCYLPVHSENDVFVPQSKQLHPEEPSNGGPNSASFDRLLQEFLEKK